MGDLKIKTVHPKSVFSVKSEAVCVERFATRFRGTSHAGLATDSFWQKFAVVWVWRGLQQLHLQQQLLLQ